MSLSKPCKNCPFRTDLRPYLRGDRAEEIFRSLLGGGVFHCHETVDYSDDDDCGDGQVAADSQFCAGALILMEKDDDEFEYGAGSNQMVRIYGRTGTDLVAGLDMDAPVYDRFEDWMQANEEENG